MISLLCVGYICDSEKHLQYQEGIQSWMIEFADFCSFLGSRQTQWKTRQTQRKSFQEIRWKPSMLTFMSIYRTLHFFFQMSFHNLRFMLTLNHALKNKNYFITLKAFTPQNVHLQTYILSSHGRLGQHRLTCNSSNNEACLGASWSLTQSV